MGHCLATGLGHCLATGLSIARQDVRSCSPRCTVLIWADSSKYCALAASGLHPRAAQANSSAESVCPTQKTEATSHYPALIISPIGQGKLQHNNNMVAETYPGAAELGTADRADASISPWTTRGAGRRSRGSAPWRGGMAASWSDAAAGRRRVGVRSQLRGAYPSGLSAIAGP